MTYQSYNVKAMNAVLVKFLRPYQLSWLWTANKYKHASGVAMLGCRQVGKDLTWAFYAVVDCLTRCHRWNLFSATLPTAILWMKDIRRWVVHLRKAVQVLTGVTLPAILKGNDSKTVLEFTNGSMIICHAASLRSAIGLRGSVAFNEVGQLPHAGDLYNTIFPIAERARDEGQDSKFFIFSNATHEGHWWHLFWENKDIKNAGSSEEFVKIIYPYQAYLDDMGFTPVEQTKMRARKIKALGIEAYEQWYECKWRGIGGGYIDPALITRQTWTWDQLQAESRDGCVLGWDPARTNDPSAIAPLHLCQSGHRYGDQTWAATQMPYKEQRGVIEEMAGIHGPCFATGVEDTGNQSCAEELENDPDVVSCGQVIRVDFGGDKKWPIFKSMRDALELGHLWIPPHDLDLAMEIGAIRTGLTAGGKINITWDKGKDSRGKHQHGDRAAAYAIANHISKDPAVYGWVA